MMADRPSYRRAAKPVRSYRLGGKSDPTMALVSAVTTALERAGRPQPTPEVHIHIDRGAFQIDATSHVDAGAVVLTPHIDATTHIADGAVRVDAPITVEAPKPTDVAVVRDGVGRVAGIKVQ